ncbi:MAG: Flp pilus assembly protein CpaB [Hyphomonas sp.]|uniref:Flp pilus assembly protein CpaB n=1 Tax=Hyphomonas sp. TaxID=87 RepID=UPI0018365D9C|nr:Flp pilus assembly protein CpaB [Hyphomonas sp.]MBA3069371.1 Flp pilus assembly protein CpaB [Hyphomonas sp.]MBU4063753.1 Flp pilus assembly protein CpaB [Alphaproteobacteria bacterium]MBU4164286.1 Flp pilus assembly protein CpaB [Alphaproteobacteria bacterium]
MSPMRIIILLLALAAAGGAAFLVIQLSKPQVVTETVTKDQLVIQQTEVSEVNVLTVTRDFASGETVKAEDLKWSPWPKANVVDGFYVETAAPASIETLTGAVVKTALYKGEPLLPQKIAIKGEQGLLSAMMNPDMRAVSVEISAESASGGFVLPNDRVDVILTYDQKAQPERGIVERAMATTIIKNVRVLAIDQNFAATEEGEVARLGNTATLEVSPSEAELLAMSQRLGEVSLSLRPLDQFVSGTSRDPRTELLEGDGGSSGAGITIIRNGQPAPAGVGGN